MRMLEALDKTVKNIDYWVRHRLIEEPKGRPFLEIEDFRETLPNFETLVEQLHPQLESCKYTAVVADEFSGHLPAYVFFFLINKIRKDKKLPPIRIYHIDPFADDTKARSTQIATANNEILIVTEYVKTGYSLKDYVNWLQSLKVGVDIATINTFTHIYNHNYKGMNVFSGGTYGQGTPFYNKININLFFSFDMMPKNLTNRTEAKKARKDTHTMANYLYEKFFT